jgi:hypothetical protein
MNELQKKVYIILNCELNTYERLKKHNMMTVLLGRCINHLSGHKSKDEPIINEADFVREVNKVLHLTSMTTDEMIQVLRKLVELWR